MVVEEMDKSVLDGISSV